MRRSALLAALALAAPALATPLAARADCQADIGRMEKQVQQVPPGARRQSLDLLVQRARREILENDELECSYAAHDLTQKLQPPPPKAP